MRSELVSFDCRRLLRAPPAARARRARRRWLRDPSPPTGRATPAAPPRQGAVRRRRRCCGGAAPAARAAAPPLVDCLGLVSGRGRARAARSTSFGRACASTAAAGAHIRPRRHLVVGQSHAVPRAGPTISGRGLRRSDRLVRDVAGGERDRAGRSGATRRAARRAARCRVGRRRGERLSCGPVVGRQRFGAGAAARRRRAAALRRLHRHGGPVRPRGALRVRVAPRRAAHLDARRRVRAARRALADGARPPRRAARVRARAPRPRRARHHLPAPRVWRFSPSRSRRPARTSSSSRSATTRTSPSSSI